jgi:hypothetical protein
VVAGCNRKSMQLLWAQPGAKGWGQRISGVLSELTSARCDYTPR